MHTEGSLRYRGQVLVPHLTDLREEILREFPLLSICFASKWHKDVSISSSPVLLERNEATR